MSNSYPVYKPKTKKPKKGSASSGGTSTSGSGGSGGGSASGGGGGGGGGYSSYLASQKKAQRKAARRYIDQAEAMSGQIKALKKALSTGFKTALEQRLRNIALVQGQQDAVLMEGYAKRVKTLEGAAEDNEKSAADSTFQNLGNRARERTNAVTEAMNQGAGESDVLKSQLMSLRNWDSNQGEITRSFFDTLRSVNSSLTDLNVDTKTGRVNIASQANADRDQVYSQYYNQRSETYTQLGNLYGQQGELFGMAQEQAGNPRTKKRRRRAVRASDTQFQNAVRANSQVWKNPGAGSALMAWQGEEPIQGDIGGNTIESAALNEPIAKKPEGASLRRWET